MPLCYAELSGLELRRRWRASAAAFAGIDAGGHFAGVGRCGLGGVFVPLANGGDCAGMVAFLFVGKHLEGF